MHILETATNLAARPLGFDFYVERWCGLLDLKNYQLGAERRTGRYPTLLLWVGPLHLAISRT